jgi:hypothetical protein
LAQNEGVEALQLKFFAFIPLGGVDILFSKFEINPNFENISRVPPWKY